MLKTISTPPRYTDAFWNFQKGRNFVESELSCVPKADGGGYYLPTENHIAFRKEMARMNIFRQIATTHFTETAMKIAMYLPSGEATFEDDIPFGMSDIATMEVKTHQLAKITKISTALICDAGFDFANALASDFGRSFGKAEEFACINGDGLKQPYGILHSTQGAETGVNVTSGQEISFDDVISLFFSVDAEYRRNGVWLMNDKTALHLRTLKDSAGNPLWNHADSTILGMPVYTSPHMPEIGSGTKPILFGDFSFYWLIERGGISLRPLRDKFAAYGLTGFLGTMFIDGRLVRQEAVMALEMV